MPLRTLWRVGVILCACLALGALCGFALPVPEDWLARDPDFSLTCPVPGDDPEEETVTVVPLPEDEDLGISVIEPEPLPEGPLVAVFLTWPRPIPRKTVPPSAAGRFFVPLR